MFLLSTLQLKTTITTVPYYYNVCPVWLWWQFVDTGRWGPLCCKTECRMTTCQAPIYPLHSIFQVAKMPVAFILLFLLNFYNRMQMNKTGSDKKKTQIESLIQHPASWRDSMSRLLPNWASEKGGKKTAFSPCSWLSENFHCYEWMWFGSALLQSAPLV